MSERPDMVHDGKSEQGRSGHRSHDTAEDHSGGGGGHHAHMVADLRRRFWVSVILSIPVLALAPPIQAWLGLSETLAFPGDRSVQAVFATITYLYGGWPFLRGVASELARDVAEVLLEIADDAVDVEIGIVGLELAGRSSNGPGVDVERHVAEDGGADRGRPQQAPHLGHGARAQLHEFLRR